MATTLAQLLGPDGRPVRSTPPKLSPLLSAGDAAPHSSWHPSVADDGVEGTTREWRVLAAPVRKGGAVVVARSLAGREDALHRIYREFLIAGPLAVLLAALAGYALAAAALRPVEMMRRRAARVTPAAPGALLRPPGT